MTCTNLEGDKGSTSKRVATMPLMKPLIAASLLLIFCPKPSSAIGSWGKKTAAVEAEKTSDASSNSDMEKTYLDLFGESAKEFLTQKAPVKIKTVFPDTDKDCRWDWRYVRCEPYCDCSFQPKLPGDFHLGRACRKRSHLGSIEDQSGAENPSFESTDEMYREYCVMEENGNLVGYREKSLTPPPPSIPSPFPYIAKSGKATWNILRTKADPVVEKAVDEFEILHSRVQSIVCKDLKFRCSDDERAGSRSNSSAPMEFAWQEKLFCRDVVRDCNASTQLHKELTGIVQHS